MINKIKALYILSLLPILVYPCDCGIFKMERLQKMERENSECILVGEVISINKDDSTYVIKVVESLDGGDVQDNTYIGKEFTSCEPFINKKGIWLIYGSTKDGFLKMNECGLSRSFGYSEVLVLQPYLNEIDAKNLDISEKRKSYFTTLYFELKALRSNRQQRRLKEKK